MMNVPIKVKYLFFLLFFSIFTTVVSCGEEEDMPVMPSDLSFEVEQDAQNPAMVTVTISSQNTEFYRVFFGEDGEGVPQATKEQTVSHTYSGSGTYTIRVQAHATEILFISESESFTLDLGEDEDEGDGEVPVGEAPGIPETGYTSPESYEGMELVWQDEFDGNELNLEDWTFETGTGSGGWGNNELQYYRKENTAVEDGFLIITAKEESYQGMNYTSSRIITQGKQEFQYGRIDIRAALPKGQGLWPALWMLGSNFSTAGWPASGEIDIMEMVGGGPGRDNVVHGTIHWSNGGQYASYGSGDAGGGHELENGVYADEFHVFSIIWDETSITWYVDDEQFHVVDITPEELSEFHQEFFLIFNVAVGGRWPGSPDATTSFPQQMVVDYVRVFQEQ